MRKKAPGSTLSTACERRQIQLTGASSPLNLSPSPPGTPSPARRRVGGCCKSGRGKFRYAHLCLSDYFRSSSSADKKSNSKLVLFLLSLSSICRYLDVCLCFDTTCHAAYACDVYECGCCKLQPCVLYFI